VHKTEREQRWTGRDTGVIITLPNIRPLNEMVVILHTATRYKMFHNEDE